MDIPLNVDVYGPNGPIGHSTHIILNPITEEVTHVVVQEDFNNHAERLVPVEDIQESDTDMIRLTCNNIGLSRMEIFEKVEFMPTTLPVMEASAPTNGYNWPYIVAKNETRFVKIVNRHIPPYERGLRRGANVYASNGRIGQIDEVVVDRKTMHLTHLVLREGHLWGQKDIMIPVDEIENIEENNIYLKLDKKSVEALPTFPVHRHRQH
ncbi:MAG: PRC-barrel domain-containing protein [Ardenticatenaceae bacterium]|nr:PRC-barrel domain-containing protein [Ardenticatenaceae bacterium]MCB9445356.1 PRC-barrel domain-containing protein [Ardenticatenaceae bacterium]